MAGIEAAGIEAVFGSLERAEQFGALANGNEVLRITAEDRNLTSHPDEEDYLVVLSAVAATGTGPVRPPFDVFYEACLDVKRVGVAYYETLAGDEENAMDANEVETHFLRTNTFGFGITNPVLSDKEALDQTHALFTHSERVGNTERASLTVVTAGLIDLVIDELLLISLSRPNTNRAWNLAKLSETALQTHWALGK